MSEERLTKEEAFKLITSVVDDEVDKATQDSFFQYVKSDPEVRSEYESVKRIKQLVEERCPREKAPDRLKVRVQEFIFEEIRKENNDAIEGSADLKSVDRPSHIPDTADKKMNAGDTDSSSGKWYLAAAATFLLVAILWGVFTIDNSTLETPTYQIEEYVYKHFEDNDGKLVPPHIATASLADAEVSISSNYDISLTVPALKNADFKGVVYSEFVPDFKAPLLEYYLPEEDQYIYIFAFPVDQLNQFGKLNRDQEAVRNCVKKSDFHIENVKGKHVVSWRWDGTWYAAISNHNGKTLASLVEPLNYEAGSN